MILAFICDNIERRGYPPTMREIGEHFHIRSTNGVNDHLRALERKGHITRDEVTARGIRVVGLNDQPGPPPPPKRTYITVEREEVFSAVERIEALSEWFPGPMSDRFEEAIASLRTALHRGTQGRPSEAA